MRMIIPIINARNENDVYYLIKSNTPKNYALQQAVLVRRVIPINMNVAMARGKELRKVMQELQYPNLLDVLDYIVLNHQEDLIMLMRQEASGLDTHYLSFPWFAYIFWQLLGDWGGTNFDDIANAIRKVAEERESRSMDMAEQYRQEVKLMIGSVEPDAEALRREFRKWVAATRQERGLQASTPADMLDLLIKNATEAGVIFTKPRMSDEVVEVSKRVINLLCVDYNAEDYTSIDLDICTPRTTSIDKKFLDTVNNLLKEGRIIVYLRARAFRTDESDSGIGSPRTFLGKERKPYRLGSESGSFHGYRFTLDEFLQYLFGINPGEVPVDEENTSTEGGEANEVQNSGGNDTNE